jgi:hypothetical protein
MILLRGTDVLDCINDEFYQSDEVDAVIVAKDARIAELESRIAEIEMEALVPLDYQLPRPHDLRKDPEDLPDSGRHTWVLIDLSDGIKIADKAYYSKICGGGGWVGWSGLMIDGVIAWQELPSWEGVK